MAEEPGRVIVARIRFPRGEMLDDEEPAEGGEKEAPHGMQA